LSNCYGVVEGINTNPTNENFLIENNEIGLEVNIKFNAMEKDTSYYIKPALGLDKQLIYTYPDRVNELKVKTKLADSFFESYFTEESKLDYTNFDIGNNGSFTFKDWTVQMVGINTTPTHKNYIKKDGDIAVSAKLIVSNNKTGKQQELEPLYIIRGNKPMVVKEYDPIDGLHLKFFSIDPSVPKFYFGAAVDKREFTTIPLEIAEDAPRSDWILMEAVIFPGINLFWLGSILMMIGFAFSFISRIKSKL